MLTKRKAPAPNLLRNNDGEMSGRHRLGISEDSWAMGTVREEVGSVRMQGTFV